MAIESLDYDFLEESKKSFEESLNQKLTFVNNFRSSVTDVTGKDREKELELKADTEERRLTIALIQTDVIEEYLKKVLHSENEVDCVETVFHDLFGFNFIFLYCHVAEIQKETINKTSCKYCIIDKIFAEDKNDFLVLQDDLKIKLELEKVDIPFMIDLRIDKFQKRTMFIGDSAKRKTVGKYQK